MKPKSKFYLVNLIVSLSLSGIFFPVLSFDHSHLGFDSLLKKYVKNGMVDYKGIKIEEEKLNIYLSELSSVSLKDYSAFAKEEKLSFLINAYNAFTIKLILDNYPLKSIRKIGFLPGAAWKTDFFSLLGEKRNLDWIEHSKLRIDFDEPRIHFAIVCASIGCPPLASSAYISKSINSQLQSSMENFLADKSKNKYDASANTLYLSKIFDWFSGDFTRNSTLISFVKSGMKIEIPENATIKYTDYNWDLNEKK